jgi:hypothetical protein
MLRLQRIYARIATGPLDLDLRHGIRPQFTVGTPPTSKDKRILHDLG